MSAVSPTILFDQEVYLHDVGSYRSIQKCFAFACSLEYHLIGEIPQEMCLEDIKTLAYMYDKVVYVYDEDSVRMSSYNINGTGYIILSKNTNDIYKVVSVLDEKNQHITLFSFYNPTIQYFYKIVNSL